MLYPLRIPNAYGYSSLDHGDPFPANSYLFAVKDANVLIDPLPLDEATSHSIAQLGGISTIVLMTADRHAVALEIASRYGARIVDRPSHREQIAPGFIAIGLPHQRNGDTFAVDVAAQRTVLAGDAIVGAPAGALSMHEAGYNELRSAALGLRRILRRNPEALLVSRGQSFFSGAYDALYRLLYATAGAEVHRINLDELDFCGDRDEHAGEPSLYRVIDAEVGFEIGARGLGYRVSTLLPGRRFCPLHSHAREEELFYVIDGTPSIRMSAGTIRCRKGDFIAFPVGDSGTHQLFNDSDAPATVLLLARTEAFEACYYPDSDKLLVDTPASLDGRNSILVAAHPELDYFQGE